MSLCLIKLMLARVLRIVMIILLYLKTLLFFYKDKSAHFCQAQYLLQLGWTELGV